LYWITQLPNALKVTTPLEIEQILEDPEAMVIATLNPELALAVGVYVPATTGETGDVEVRVMVWEEEAITIEKGEVVATAAFVSVNRAVMV
jgi:hypothetical protein